MFKKAKTKPIAVLIIIFVVSVVAGVFAYHPLWQKISDFRPWQLGLDLAGGSFLTFDIDLSDIKPGDRDVTVGAVRDRIERRVSPFGIAEPRVYSEIAGGEHRLVVELAGVYDIDEALSQIGEMPILDFREVEEVEEGELVFHLTELTGRHIHSAGLSRDPVTREWSVDLEFDREGTKIFAELTEKNIGKPLAIFLDGDLIEMPVVREKIAGGRAQISGRFTQEEVRQLVQRFRDGALPAPVTLVNQHTVSADFGRESLMLAFYAGVIGLLSVAAFMVVYYRKLGIFATIALLIYVVLLLAIFKLIPITLTLAGVAGIILSIGMAVDANILVFERTKEELKKGAVKEIAIEEGFLRAWNSIRDANLSTLISSAVLYYFTTSFVQGFALALFVGVLMSMFSAIVVTRTLLRVFY